MNIKAMLMDGELTVILPDGNMMYSSGVSKEIFKKVQEAETEEQLQELLYPELFEDVRKFDEQTGWITEEGEVEIEEDVLYLNGKEYKIPGLLGKYMDEAIDSGNKDRLEALKNFWFWLVTNPNKDVVDGAFQFIQNHGFHLTKNGFLVAFRWVVATGQGNKELVEFISKEYVRIKTRKKGPRNYYVWKNDDGQYFLYHVEATREDVHDEGETKQLVGNLHDLYVDLPNMQEKTFTDGYTKKMDIRIGQEVRMERKDSDEDKYNSCSSGLHFCSNLADYSSFGGVPLIVAINPRNIVAVPEGASTKARCCAYMPLAIVGDGKSYKDFDLTTEGALELCDEYAEEQLGELQDIAKSLGAQRAKKEYQLSSIGDEGLNDVLEALQEAREVTGNRVITLD